MSSDIRALRELSNDPYGKFLAALSKKFSAFLAKDQAEQVENPEDIFSDGQDFDSVLKYHNFAMTKKFDLLTNYYSASEPDNDTCKLMLGIPWINLGNQIPDKSGFNHQVGLFGDPILIDGAPFNLGLVDNTTGNTKSIAIKFNRGSIREWMEITDATDIRVTGTVGMSYFCRFRLHDLSTMEGKGRTIFEKIDDSTPTAGAMMAISSDGRVNFYVKRAGVEYNVRSPTNTIAVDTVYDVFCTYAVTGNVQHIYVNGVDQSLTDPGGVSWQDDLTDFDMFIFRRGRGSAGGYVDGDFYNFTMWRGKVVSSTEVSRHFTNKLTLANIPFGQVAVSNYSSTLLAVVPSFTSTSFTATSFRL